jgi:hypothetical protein
MKPIEKKVVAANYSNTSDGALVVLLDRLKVAVDRAEIRKLSGQIERVVFHKQIRNT